MHKLAMRNTQLVMNETHKENKEEQATFYHFQFPHFVIDEYQKLELKAKLHGVKCPAP